jgi:putative cell wall-binding protein
MHKNHTWLRRTAVGGLSVLAMGGTGLVALAAPASANAAFTLTRVSGANRYATAAAIAASAYPSGPSSKTAIVSTGVNFPDALAGSYLAGQLGAPILLTDPNTLSPETATALGTLGITTVDILGGSAAVSDSVANAISAKSIMVHRISGPTRYDTMQAVDTQSGQTAGTATVNGITGPTAILATGNNFPDALGAGPVAFADKLPIVLTNGTAATLSTQALAVITADHITNLIVVGGSAAINPTQYAGYNHVLEAGSNRSATSAALASYAVANLGLANTGMDVANGFDPSFNLPGLPVGFTPDALAGSVLAGSNKVPTLITDSPSAVGSACTFATSEAATLVSGNVFGGSAAVTDASISAIQACGRTAAVSGVVSLATTSAAPGAVVNGTLTNPSAVSGLSVTGCGLTNQALTFNSTTGAFSMTIPASATVGACSLVFTATQANGSAPTITTISFTVTAPVTGSVTVTPTSGNPGAVLSGLVTNPTGVTSLSVSGCGLSGAVPFNAASGAFSVTIPASATVGACNLVFTANNANGTTQTTTIAFTVTAPTPPPVLPGVGSIPAHTAGPDLISATVDHNVVNGGVPNTVIYTFDQPIQTVNGSAPTYPTFGLRGYSEARSTNQNARADLDPSNPDAVIAQFPDTVDVATYTIAVADSCVVQDFSNRCNPLASVALGGSTFNGVAGETSGPSLLSASVNTAASQITYCFNQNVTTPSPSHFVFYDVNGAESFGSSVVPPGVSAECVVVNFTSNVGSAVREAVAEGAVRDQNGANPNPEGAVGAATTAPELTNVTQTSPGSNLFDFTFNQPVTVNHDADFHVYTDGDIRYSGTADTRPSSTVVEVQFSALNQFNAGRIVLGTVADFAVSQTSGAFLDNTIGAVPIANHVGGPGTTDGPDLLSATYNVSGDQVTYTFDNSIDPTSVNPKAFFVISGTDIATFSTAATPVNVIGDTVTIQFPPGSVGTAAGAGVTTHTGFFGGNGEQQTGGPAFNGTQVGLTGLTSFNGVPNSPSSTGGGPSPINP